MDKLGSNPVSRKTLARSMSYGDYVALGLGTIVGVGWVVLAGDWLVRGGPLGAILGFLIGGLILGAVGLCYAELAPALPLAGGAVAFSYKAFGTRTSFLTGWFLSFAYITVCPFEAVAIGWIMESLFPSLPHKALYSVGGQEVSLVSIAAGVVSIFLIAAINYRGIRSTARFQTYSTALMIGCAAIFVLVALLKGSFSNLKPFFAGNGSVGAGVGSILAILGIVPFFMSGFDTIAQGSEESGKQIDPRNIGRAVLLSIAAGALFYAVVILALSVCLPWKESVRLDMPTASVLKVAFGYGWSKKLVLFTAFLGLVTSFNGCFLAGCRVLFAMGRGGLLPRALGDVQGRYKTPHKAIMFVCLLSLIGPFLGRTSLNPIVNVGSLAYVCGWFMTCLSAVRLRRVAPDLHRPFRVKRRLFLYLGTLVSGALILLMIVPGSSAQLAWPLEYSILTIWMLLGFFGYRWRRAAKDMDDRERSYQILGEYR
jgi:basic amino acid/polyamine antiporter, APA family